MPQGSRPVAAAGGTAIRSDLAGRGKPDVALDVTREEEPRLYNIVENLTIKEAPRLVFLVQLLAIQVARLTTVARICEEERITALEAQLAGQPLNLNRPFGNGRSGGPRNDPSCVVFQAPGASQGFAFRDAWGRARRCRR